MLEKIVKVINEFQKMYDAEKAKMNAEIVRIQNTYNETSKEYYDLKVVVRNVFNEKIETEKLAAIENIQMYAADDKKALADITSRPAPTDAITTIELLKAGDPTKTSEFEVQSILEKYKDNYLATKMIVQITDAFKRFGITCSSADDIVQDIDEVERRACDFIRQYNGNVTYMQAVLLKGDIVMNVNEQVQNFLQYNYISRLSEMMRKAMNA